MWWNDLKEIKEWMTSISFHITSLEMRYNALLVEEDRDKLIDFLKNIDKFNEMVNEFKGCVSMARAAIAERKTWDEEVKGLKKVAEISEEIYDSMRAFIHTGHTLEKKGYFKLDAIYKAVCEKGEKKSSKKRRKESD